MKIIKYEDNESWLEGRRCKITGTKLKDILPLDKPRNEIYGDKRAGFFRLIAENISIASDSPNPYEKPMDRGLRLEEIAIEELTKKTGIVYNTDKVIWSRDDNDNIAVSPDGYTEDLKQAAEIKCLDSGKHVEALLLKRIPDEYKYQILQYFIVNEQLELLHFAMFDPRFIINQLLVFAITRAEKQQEIDVYLEIERKTLEEVDEIVKELIKEI